MVRTVHGKSLPQSFRTPPAVASTMVLKALVKTSATTARLTSTIGTNIGTRALIVPFAMTTEKDFVADMKSA